MELATSTARLTVRVADISADLRLLSLSSQEALAELSRTTLIVASADELPDPDAWLGRDVSVRMRGRYGSRYLHGALCAAKRLQDAGRFQRMQLTLVPHAWWLTQRSRYRIYTNQSTPDIARSLWQEAGLRLDDLVLDLKQTVPVWQYRTQAGESDWDFLCRLFNELGCVGFFRHSEGRHQLIFTDHAGAWPRPASEALASHYDHQPGQPEMLYRLQRQRTRTLGRADVQRYRARHTQRYDTFQAGHNDTSTGRHAHLFVHHQDAPEAAITARTRLNSHTAGQDVLTAQGNRMDLGCGEIRTLIMPDGTRSDWLITGLTQQFHQPQVLEELAQGSWQHYQTLTAVPADTPWRPLPRPRPMIHGYWPSVVTGPEKGRVHTDGQGAVRVRFAWDPEGSEGTWIRVSQRLAGNHWGTLALPRAGDEVSVHFIEGHPDTPVVCGRRYHAAHEPPQVLPEGKHQWMFRSRSGEGAGHEALLDDSSDQPAALLHSSGTLTQHALRDRHEQGEGSRHQKIAADTALSTGGGLSVRAEGSFEEHVDQGIHLSAGQALVLAGQSLTAEAGSALHIKAGNAVVNAGQTVVFKVGGSAVSVGPGGVSLSAPSVMINMGGGGGSASAASGARPAQVAEVPDHPGARATVPAQGLKPQDNAAKIVGLGETATHTSAKTASSKPSPNTRSHAMPPAAQVIPAATLTGALTQASARTTYPDDPPHQAPEAGTDSVNQEAPANSADEVETFSVTADASGPRLPETGLYELIDTSGNKLAETPAEHIFREGRTVHIPFEGKVPSVSTLLFWTDGEESESRVLVRKVAGGELKPNYQNDTTDPLSKTFGKTEKRKPEIDHQGTPKPPENNPSDGNLTLSPSATAETNGSKAHMQIKGFDNERYNKHDDLITEIVEDINKNKKITIGLTDEQLKQVPDLDPRLVKSWMIQESGGNDAVSLAAWDKDPLQVNVPGDWNPHKKSLGLTKPLKRNTGDLRKNIQAGIIYMIRKGFGVSGQPPSNRPTGFFDGYPEAIRRYNGRTDKINEETYSQAYSKRILERYRKKDEKIPIALK